MHILVTGGAGFIGSHVCVALLQQGFRVTVADNFCNSSPVVLDRIFQISGRRAEVLEIDLRCELLVKNLFSSTKFDCVIHLAGLKSVSDSKNEARRYYDVNIVSTLNLLRGMESSNCKNIIFSSSATVYASAGKPPFSESGLLYADSVYGRTKLFQEQILSDWSLSREDVSVVILRYFNPIGAHESALMGENPRGTPNNLMPYICDVATGKQPFLRIFGNDYPTPDGTGLRDYIHVVDLANGHLAAMKALDENGVSIFNLGSGQPYSVLEVVRTFERVTGRTIATSLSARRSGDVAVSYADTSKARDELSWDVKHDLSDMCADAWRWAKISGAKP